MTHFFRAGGFSIWLVLLFSLLLLAAAGSFALRPMPRKLTVIRPLTLTLLFSSIAGTVTNFMAVAFHTTGREAVAADPDVWLIVLHGLGEAVTPAVLGFTALSLVWLFVAVGARRQGDLEP